jgi:Flp pilus assembly protein TadG
MRDERGVVAVITAVVLVSLLGISAIVIDVGSLYHNRRFLQNGADAGALALAQACASGNGNCGSYDTTAVTYAQNNSPSYAQSLSAIVCGSSGTNLPQTCSTPSSVPTGATGWVEVTTSARVDYTFARVMGFTNKTVTATAIAAWGAPGSAISPLPLTISTCTYDHFADSDADGEHFNPLAPNTFDNDPGSDNAYPDLPPASPLPPDPHYAQEYIYFHTSTSMNPNSGCNPDPADWNLPGGFGWLQTTGTGCNTATEINNWYSGKTGTSVPSGCTLPAVPTLVQIPIFTCTNFQPPQTSPCNTTGTTGTGANGMYYIQAYATFYLTGYRFPGQCAGNVKCGGPDDFIAGWFINGGASGTGSIGGPPLGANVVQLIG